MAGFQLHKVGTRKKMLFVKNDFFAKFGVGFESTALKKNCIRQGVKNFQLKPLRRDKS
jgi:hypothetical protein